MPRWPPLASARQPGRLDSVYIRSRGFSQRNCEFSTRRPAWSTTERHIVAWASSPSGAREDHGEEDGMNLRSAFSVHDRSLLLVGLEGQPTKSRYVLFVKCAMFASVSSFASAPSANCLYQSTIPSTVTSMKSRGVQPSLCRPIASSACRSATPPACSRRPRLRPVVQLFTAICTPGKKKIALAEDVGGEILLDHMSLVAAANDEIPDAVEGGSRVS